MQTFRGTNGSTATTYKKPNDINNYNGGGGGGGTRIGNNGADNNSGGGDDDDLPEALKKFGKDLVEKIEHEIMDHGEQITFDDIAGLHDAKETIQELVCWPMKRPDLFTGLRRTPNGLLLFGMFARTV